MSIVIPRNLLVSGILFVSGAAVLTAQCENPSVPGPTTPGGSPPVAGPGDVVGPGSGPRTGRPSGPAPTRPGGPAAGALPPPPPPPSGPITGGGMGPRPLPPGGAAAGVPASTGPRGMPIGVDLTSWKVWWQYNSDAFLPLRKESTSAPITGSDEFYLGATRSKASSGLRPSTAQLRDEILPVLQRAIDSGPAGVTAAALLAIARVEIDHPEFRRAEVISAQLAADQQSVRESAALALGLCGDARDVMRLCDVLSGERARSVRGDAATTDRTRAFAAYGLGLLARSTNATSVKKRIYEALEPLLLDATEDREVRVAAVQAISMLAIDRRAYEGQRLLTRVLDALEKVFDEDVASAGAAVQAHCPTAIARLLGAEHHRASHFARRFAARLTGRSDDGRVPVRVPAEVSQSCAMALGTMVRAGQGRSAAAALCADIEARLLTTWRDHKDAQTRNFAMLSLGRIGGDGNRTRLLRAFDKANKGVQQPWCALALGLLAGEHRRQRHDVDAFVVETLEQAFRRARNPEAAGALAVALGLAGAPQVVSPLVERLGSSVALPALAGSVCDALAMLGDPESRAALRTFLGDSERDPEMFHRAGAALGLLDDGVVIEILCNRFVDGEPDVAIEGALAETLADVGDRRHVAPLLRVLDDASRSAATRAAAARAIGGIVRRGSIRWNTPLRDGANYRAEVATLTDRVAGVLDLR